MAQIEEIKAQDKKERVYLEEANVGSLNRGIFEGMTSSVISCWPIIMIWIRKRSAFANG